MADTTIPLIVKAPMNTTKDATVSILPHDNIAWIRHMHGFFFILFFSALFAIFGWCDPPMAAGGPSLMWISFTQASVWESIHDSTFHFLLVLTIIIVIDRHLRVAEYLLLPPCLGHYSLHPYPYLFSDRYLCIFILRIWEGAT